MDVNNVDGVGKYIYGIIKNPGNIDYGPIGIGKRGDHVYGVGYKDICAVVSTSHSAKYDARRVNMIDHETVLEKIMENSTVLPVRFSTISTSNNDESITKILEREYDKLLDLLAKMEGKKELGLKVLGTEAKVYESIIEKYENIKILRAKILKMPDEKAHYQKVKIGEMVAEALKNEVQIYKDVILEKLTPIAEQYKVNDTYGNMMILNAAFLIKDSVTDKFDSSVNELDLVYGDMMTFKYVGTLPPYNFVNLVINTSGE